jgi:aspartyl-tRNA(Asn)/glutamyl-tRNA(Gln) amidotransferase subunit B
VSRYEVVIGLEVHAQLSTVSKMFCGCSTTFGSRPNTQVCPVCLGLPGALPVVNARAVEFAVRLGLATECTIAHASVFARKNYFYPDCPKNYQISQFETPLCTNGRLSVADGERLIRIRRIHLEEDAGKLLHVEGADHSLVDMNRSGVPLVEIVSEPDLRTPQEASEYLQKLRSLVRYLDICDGNMEEGSLRCDVNLSVRKHGEGGLGTKSEIKNLNSFKQVEQAIEFEFVRQTEIIESGARVKQDTLLWDAASRRAVVMRSKEEAHDYRYFPEPDLRTLRVAEELIARVRAGLPELPDAKQKRFVSEYGIPAYDAHVLTSSADLADYFEKVVSHGADAKAASNWVMGEVMRELNEHKIDVGRFGIRPDALAELVTLQASGKVNSSTAKEVFKEMLASGNDAASIVKVRGLEQVSDNSAIEKEAIAVLDENPDEVKRYLSGKEQLLQFFVGQLMKRTRGKANAQMATTILKQQLEVRR